MSSYYKGFNSKDEYIVMHEMAEHKKNILNKLLDRVYEGIIRNTSDLDVRLLAESIGNLPKYFEELRNTIENSDDYEFIVMPESIREGNTDTFTAELSGLSDDYDFDIRVTTNPTAFTMLKLNGYYYAHFRLTDILSTTRSVEYKVSRYIDCKVYIKPKNSAIPL